MSQIAYIIQRVPKNIRNFVELEKSTGKFYLLYEDAENDRLNDPILKEFLKFMR